MKQNVFALCGARIRLVSLLRSARWALRNVVRPWQDFLRIGWPKKLRHWRVAGVTLVELLISLLLVALLAAIALPSYKEYRKRVDISVAKKDIVVYGLELERFMAAREAYPASLAELGPVRLDPWGTPYQYLSMAGAKVGQKRKDKSLHPLNSDYDLYSMGPDRKSQTPLTARASRDDIIRANNGGFIGVAEDY